MIYTQATAPGKRGVSYILTCFLLERSSLYALDCIAPFATFCVLHIFCFTRSCCNLSGHAWYLCWCTSSALPDLFLFSEPVWYAVLMPDFGQEAKWWDHTFGSAISSLGQLPSTLTGNEAFRFAEEPQTKT